MEYNQFAYHYDALMSDVNYSDWVRKLAEYAFGQGQLLDVGCGTGKLSLLFRQAGFAVTGVDLSEDMLVVAKEAAEVMQADVHFAQGDMRDLSAFSDIDIVTINVDALNYLLTADDVRLVFEQVHNALKPGGLFMFDVHAAYKLETHWQDYLYADASELLTYIWHAESYEEVDDEQHLFYEVQHDLTFFTRLENGAYKRHDEVHIQRTFHEEHYIEWLEVAGFDLVEMCGDFHGEVDETSERIIFIARKAAS